MNLVETLAPLLPWHPQGPQPWKQITLVEFGSWMRPTMQLNRHCFEEQHGSKTELRFRFCGFRFWSRRTIWKWQLWWTARTALHAHIKTKQSVLFKMVRKPTFSKGKQVGQFIHLPSVPQRRCLRWPCWRVYHARMGDNGVHNIQMFWVQFSVHAWSWRFP